MIASPGPARLGWAQWTLASLGLTAAASLWALNTQLGEILPYPECRLNFPFTAVVSAAALLLSLISGAISWRIRRFGDRRSFVFIARMGAGAACLFAFALILQGAAGLIISGCER